MQAYVVKLQERLDEGIVQENSNKVIAGNVVIQQVLGVNPQFSTYDEFNALMESEDDFVL